MNRIKDKYKLELRWDSLNYQSTYSCFLNGCYFQGPALKIAAKIGAPDKITLDLTPQIAKIISSYYLVTLFWTSVEYTGDSRVNLGNARLDCLDIAEIHKFKDTDFIVINTEMHEEDKHAFNLVYPSHVVRMDNKIYDYGDK